MVYFLSIIVSIFISIVQAAEAAPEVERVVGAEARKILSKNGLPENWEVFRQQGVLTMRPPDWQELLEEALQDEGEDSSN